MYAPAHVRDPGPSSPGGAATVRRRSPWIVLLALVAVVAPAGALTAPASEASSWSEGACPDDRGVTVVVDFQALGGSTIVRCAHGSHRDGLSAVEGAGIQVTGTNRYGKAFVCRLQGKPGPESESCVDTPPASAYWSYWHAPAGGQWTYSDFGITNRTPPEGSFEGWSFYTGDTDGNLPTDYLPPRVAPQRPPPPDDSGSGGSDAGGSGSGGSGSGGSGSGSGGSGSGGSGSGGSGSGGSGSGGSGSGGSGSSGSGDPDSGGSGSDGSRDRTGASSARSDGADAASDDGSDEPPAPDDPDGDADDEAARDEDPDDPDDADEEPEEPVEPDEADDLDDADADEEPEDDTPDESSDPSTDDRRADTTGVADAEVTLAADGGRGGGMVGTVGGIALVGAMAAAGIISVRRRNATSDAPAEHDG